MRGLTDEQKRVLESAKSASEIKVGLRASYWPQCRSLEKRGLVEKRGRAVHRCYFITSAGLAALEEEARRG